MHDSRTTFDTTISQVDLARSGCLTARQRIAHDNAILSDKRMDQQLAREARAFGETPAQYSGLCLDV